MSGFLLVPVDGGAPVHVPPGDTVLGRGPLLSVSDRRISRHHAVLQNVEGKLRLKPTHVNPCFIHSPSVTDDLRPLLKDSWCPLVHGDVFSLLPGHFVYRVTEVGGTRVTAVGGARDTSARNGHKEKQEEEELPHPPEPDVEPNRPIRANSGQTPPHEESPGLSEEEEEPSPNRHLNDQEDKAVREEVDDDDDEGGGASSVMRTRVLPAWMMAVVSTPHGSSPKPKVESVKRRTAPKQATPPAADSPEEAELSEEEEEPRPRKKRRRKVRDVSDEEETPEATPTAVIDSASTTTQASDISEPEDNRKSSVPALSRRPLRTPCPYGRDCYRKNPLHFQECSHPEDTDYEDEDEDEDEGTELDRPECPYGTDCYRKNPLHRKEFRHSKTPARATRTAPKKSPAHNEDSDDSFIDDDSEDVGDDSDYVPLDTEDVHRLQKEAKEFLQSRK